MKHIKLTIILLSLSACTDLELDSSYYEESDDLRIGIIFNKRGMCTATLTAQDEVLTASHCVGDTEDAIVTFGPLKNAITLEPYNNAFRIATLARRDHDYDIAYYKLDKPVNLDPIPVETSSFPQDYHNEEVELTAWGCARAEQSGKAWKKTGTLNVLQRGTVLGFGVIIGTTGFTTCNGDSGGALISKKRNKIIGVLSTNDDGVNGYSDINRMLMNESLTKSLK